MQTYQQLAHVADKHYKDRGYCGVIAVATVAGCKYGKAYRACQRHGRKHGNGTQITTIIAALNELVPGINMFQDGKWKGTTVSQFERYRPNKEYLILVSGGRHIAAWRQGQLIDWTSVQQSGKPRRHKITLALEIVKPDVILPDNLAKGTNPL